MASDTLRITLPPDLTAFVRGRVSSGQFASADEVVREALCWFAGCSIGPHRVPTRIDAQEYGLELERARDAIARLRSLRQRSRLGPDITVAELRDQDRRGVRDSAS